MYDRWTVEPFGDRVRITIRPMVGDHVLMRVDLPVDQAKAVAAGLQDVAEQVIAGVRSVREDPED